MQILQIAVLGNSVDSDIEELVSLFRRIVGSIVTLFSPLSIVGLSRLLAVSSYEVREILHPLSSALQIEDDEDAPVQIFHL